MEISSDAREAAWDSFFGRVRMLVLATREKKGAVIKEKVGLKLGRISVCIFLILRIILPLSIVLS